MLHELKKSNEGFTIIEILIVLAIAGLIMLLVFLAVPALQRNQRNTGRRSDAARLTTASSNYVTNSNGNFPADKAAGDAILADAGTLSQFSSLTVPAGAAGTCAAGTLANGTFKICNLTGAITFNNTGVTTDAAVLVTRGQCNGTSTVQTATSGRQMALVYTLETGSGNYQLACVNV